MHNFLAIKISSERRFSLQLEQVKLIPTAEFPCDTRACGEKSPAKTMRDFGALRSPASEPHFDSVQQVRGGSGIMVLLLVPSRHWQWPQNRQVSSVQVHENFRVLPLVLCRTDENSGEQKPINMNNFWRFSWQRHGVRFVYVFCFSLGEKETRNKIPGNLRKMPGQAQNNPRIIPGQSHKYFIYVFSCFIFRPPKNLEMRRGPEIHGSQSSMKDWDADLSPCNFATTHFPVERISLITPQLRDHPFDRFHCAFLSPSDGRLIYTPPVLGGAAIVDNSACIKILCPNDNSACIKILCPNDPEFYTPLALNCQKGQRLPALGVHKNSVSHFQGTFDHDKGQKSAISGRHLHWRLSAGFFAFLQYLCAI